MVILAWCLVYAVGSFMEPLPWTRYPPDGSGGSSGSSAAAYFNDVVVLQRAGTRDLGSANSSSLSGPVYGALVATWLCIFLCIFQGVKSAGAVVKFTMPAPVILLVIMLIYNCTLEGAGAGVEAYIGRYTWCICDRPQAERAQQQAPVPPVRQSELLGTSHFDAARLARSMCSRWDMSVLKNPRIWSDACGQVFFSIGVAMVRMCGGSRTTMSCAALDADVSRRRP